MNRSSTRSVCTGCSTRRGCCPRRRSGSTPGAELWPDEVRIRVERLNLDAASFRQLRAKHGGDGDAVRAEVLDIVADPRQDAEPGDRVRRDADRHGRGGRARSRRSGLQVGDRVTTLVSLTLTPLVITDGLAALGRPLRAGPVRRLRDPVRTLHRGRASPTTCPPRWRWR